MRGYVYILSNETMPGILKIGKTKNDPSVRAKEISGTTGVPVEFKVECFARVDNRHSAEREIHRRLNSIRVNPRREFFRTDLETAKQALDSLEGAIKPVEQQKPEPKPEPILQTLPAEPAPLRFPPRPDNGPFIEGAFLWGLPAGVAFLLACMIGFEAFVVLIVGLIVMAMICVIVVPMLGDLLNQEKVRKVSVASTTKRVVRRGSPMPENQVKTSLLIITGFVLVGAAMCLILMIINI